MKKLFCLVLVFVLSFSATPSICESFLMSLYDFSTKFAEATIFYKTNHADYFVRENMKAIVDKSGSTLEIEVTTANSSIFLYFPPETKNISEIIVICQGGSDFAQDLILLLYELCYATGAFDAVKDTFDFTSEMGLDFQDGKAGYLDRNNKRYSWLLNYSTGFIFTIQPI